MFVALNLNLPFYSYGVLIFVGFILGMFIYRFNCQRLGNQPADLVDLSLTITIAPLLGARIFYIVTFPEQFSGAYDYLAIHEGGLVFYGGLIGGLMALGVFANLKKEPLRQLLDFMVPSFVVAHAIGRIGCLFNGCCYGMQTTLVKIYRLPADTENSFRHPTQIYEATFLLLTFFFLNFLLTGIYRYKRLFPGFVSGFYLISYSFFRFLIEFIRDDNRGGFFTPLHLSPSQVTAVILIAAGVYWLNHCYKYPYIIGVKLNEQS